MTGSAITRTVRSLVPMLAAAMLLVLLPGQASAARLPVLTGIRTGVHQGHDRVVFDFDGPVPSTATAGYVAVLRQDGSGHVVEVAGTARLKVVLRMASGHAKAAVTYGAQRRSVDMPNVMQIVNTGDFEGVLSFGIGVAAATPVTVSTLTSPSRVVLDIGHPAVTEAGSVALLDSRRYATGREPYLVKAPRTLARPGNAASALHRLFAGPTAAEQAAGLRFVTSGATGFTRLRITDGVATVRLVGGCASRGSTFTVADHLSATLKQFASVRWVKVLDPNGATGRPTGRSDSIPTCLEP